MARRVLLILFDRPSILNSCSHSHFVTYKVGMAGECQQCVSRERRGHSSYAPNAAALLIRQSDYVLRYASMWQWQWCVTPPPTHTHTQSHIHSYTHQTAANYVAGFKLRKHTVMKLEEFTGDSVPCRGPCQTSCCQFTLVFSRQLLFSPQILQDLLHSRRAYHYCRLTLLKWHKNSLKHQWKPHSLLNIGHLLISGYLIWLTYESVKDLAF